MTKGRLRTDIKTVNIVYDMEYMVCSTCTKQYLECMTWNILCIVHATWELPKSRRPENTIILKYIPNGVYREYVGGSFKDHVMSTLGRLCLKMISVPV